MSVQVSYKNQFVVYIFLILIFLSVVEIIANFWLYNIYRCDFEDNELFTNMAQETKRKMCHESLDLDYINDRLDWVRGARMHAGGVFDENIVYINNHGFRGPDFSQQKSDNTYRIFTVGGSTTFSVGVLDHQAWPAILQKKFDEVESAIKIEVINVGVVSKWSLHETEMIRTKLVNYEPNLFLVYDGVNDLLEHVEKRKTQASPELWEKRWAEICKLGTEKNFDTIIVLQPMVGSGERILTQQETEWYYKDKVVEKLRVYPNYLEQLDKLNTHCTKTADFTGIFDNIQAPIYYDSYHTGILGNDIIAEKFYELSLPVVMKRTQNVVNEEDSISSVKYGASSDTLEINENLDSENFDYYLEQSYSALQTILFPYKTPKVLELIVNQ